MGSKKLVVVLGVIAISLLLGSYMVYTTYGSGSEESGSAQVIKMNNDFLALSSAAKRFDVVRAEDYCEVWEYRNKVGDFQRENRRGQYEAATSGYENLQIDDKRELVWSDGYAALQAGRSIVCPTEASDGAGISEKLWFERFLAFRPRSMDYKSDDFIRGEYLKVLRREVAERISGTQMIRTTSDLYRITSEKRADRINSVSSREKALREMLEKAISEWGFSLADLGVSDEVARRLKDNSPHE